MINDVDGGCFFFLVFCCGVLWLWLGILGYLGYKLSYFYVGIQYWNSYIIYKSAVIIIIFYDFQLLGFTGQICWNDMVGFKEI